MGNTGSGAFDFPILIEGGLLGINHDYLSKSGLHDGDLEVRQLKFILRLKD